MTDHEIEIFYNSVEHADKLILQLTDENEIVLSNAVSLKKINNKIEITIDSKSYFVDHTYLLAVLNEFHQQQIQDQVNNGSSNKIDKRTDLEMIEPDKYYAHSEFLIDMIYARDVSSGQGVYLRKLEDIVKLFRMGKALVTDKKTYHEVDEFVNDYLKNQYGFTSLIDELKRK